MVESSLRRLGVVVLTVHQVVMARLLEAGRVDAAEALNDWMKPLGDMLKGYELQTQLFEGDDDETQA